MFYMLMLVIGIFYYQKNKNTERRRKFFIFKKFLWKYEIIWNVES